MPQIDFYLIPESSAQAGLSFVCRLLEKAYSQAQSVYVHLENEHEVKVLDELLWTFKEDSFIPHGATSNSHLINPPILLGYEQEPDTDAAILLNLTPDVLAFYSRFNRVIEIVLNEPETKKNSREKFRHYKIANCDLKSHDLTKL